MSTRFIPSHGCGGSQTKVRNFEDPIWSNQDVAWLDVSMALKPIRMGVFHAQAELDRPPQYLVHVQRAISSGQMAMQTHPSLGVGSDVIHGDKQAPGCFGHPSCSQDVWMPLKIHPQEGFFFESISGFGICEQLVTKCLERNQFFQLTVIDKIDDTKPALA